MKIRVLLTALAAAAACGPAHADSWVPATVQTYTSSDQSTRLVVIPRDIESPLAYFRDKTQGREPAGQARGEQAKTARAVVERRVSGKWTRVWAAPLVNDVSPVRALVSNDARHVVTFDNWHSMGLGDDTIAIYGADGRLARKLALNQVLPDFYVKALPRSVSSLHWSGTHRLTPDGQRVLVAVVVPNDDHLLTHEPLTVDVAIDLDTGTVTHPEEKAWNDALAIARKVADRRDQAEARRAAAFAAPLNCPATSDSADWYDYLTEAFFRVDPDWKETYPEVAVLGASEESPTATLARAFEGEGPRVVMLASVLAPDVLPAAARDFAGSLSPSALKDVRVYVAAPIALANPIRTNLAAHGATVIVIYPGSAIPQRPERLRGETSLEKLADGLEELGRDSGSSGPGLPKNPTTR